MHTITHSSLKPITHTLPGGVWVMGIGFTYYIREILGIMSQLFGQNLFTRHDEPRRTYVGHFCSLKCVNLTLSVLIFASKQLLYDFLTTLMLE
jgi:hypothetical protein